MISIERADWNWACNGGPTLTHGWRPESGFIPHRWQGYDEGLLLYILGLGSPTHPLPPESYAAYCATYEWKNIYDRELLFSGPLFTHQLSHMWIDFRGIRTPSCATTGPTISRTPGRQRSCNRSTRFATRRSSSATGNTAGDSRHVTGPVGASE